MTFKYKKRSAKDHKARTVKQAGSWATLMKAGIPEFKPKAGNHTVRFCPPTWEDAKHWAYDLWVNSNVGAGYGETFLSLKLMKQKPCPVAEAIAAAKAEGQGDSVKRMNPKLRAGCFVIEKGEESKGPQFWSQPQSVDVDIAALAYDDEDSSEVLWIDDPKVGHWVSFKIEMEKTPEGTFPKYKELKVHTRKGPMSKDSDEQEEWLEFLEENPLPDVLQYYDYDHIKAALDGAGTSRKKDEDEDDEPPKRRRARNEKPDEDDDEEPPKRRGRPKIDDDEAELDEEDDAPPKRRKRQAEPEDEDDDEHLARITHDSRRRKSEDDEEDEPAPKKRRKREVEDEDEDEEPPKRRRKKAEPEDDDDDEPAPKKRKRKSKSEDDDEDEEKDLRKSGGLKKRRRRSTEDDEDIPY